MVAQYEINIINNLLKHGKHLWRKKGCSPFKNQYSQHFIENWGSISKGV